MQAYCPIIRGQMDNEIIQSVAQKVRALIDFILLARKLTKIRLTRPDRSARPRPCPNFDSMVPAARVRIQIFVELMSKLFIFLSFVPLPKSETPSRIHSNAQVYDFELSEEDVTQLNSLDRGKDGAVSWNPVGAD